MNPRVGIVILSWNGGAHTVACIDSARAQSYGNRFIIVVDNASAATERDALVECYGGCDDIELLCLDRNTGYAEGNNIGMRRALGRDADWFLIATQDTVLGPETLANLVQAASSPSHVGIVGPCVRDVDGGVLSLGERVAVPLLCVPRSLIRYRRVGHQPYLVSGVLGCALLVSRDCFVSTNGFDESYFAYYEEVDLCLRARAKGFEILCAPQAVVHHQGMRGFLRGMSTASAELKARNLWRLMVAHGGFWHWPVLLPTFTTLIFGSLFLYLIRGRGDVAAALLRGVRAGLRRESGPLPSLL